MINKRNLSQDVDLSSDVQPEFIRLPTHACIVLGHFSFILTDKAKCMRRQKVAIVSAAMSHGMQCSRMEGLVGCLRGGLVLS